MGQHVSIVALHIVVSDEATSPTSGGAYLKTCKTWLVCHMSATSVHTHDVCCLCFVRGCRRVPFETKLLTGGRGDVWLFNSALIHDSTRHMSHDSLRGLLLFKIRSVVARR